MKLYAIADLHLANAANRTALMALPPHDGDWLILAGDIGETEAQRDSDKTFSVLDKQIKNGLESFVLQDLQTLVVAYEPVWAIGTGQHATPDEAQYVQATIREITGNIMGDHAEHIRIVYGGSVNENNTKALLAEADIDGALVGGASLKSGAMASIVRIAGE